MVGPVWLACVTFKSPGCNQKQIRYYQKRNYETEEDNLSSFLAESLISLCAYSRLVHPDRRPRVVTLELADELQGLWLWGAMGRAVELLMNGWGRCSSEGHKWSQLDEERGDRSWGRCQRGPSWMGMLGARGRG